MIDTKTMQDRDSVWHLWPMRFMAVLFLLFFLLVTSGTVHAEECVAPTGFTWEGGTGRLKGMECTELQLKGEEAWATLIIRSENYSYVAVDGEKYNRIEKKDGKSIFQIPVVLNEEMTIYACTTAMSTEHEIEYTICVSYDPEKANASLNDNTTIDTNTTADVTTDTDMATESSAAAEASSEEVEKDVSQTIDLESEEESLPEEPVQSEEEEIPEIEGLTFQSQMELRFAEQFDVYEYNDGYKVLSVHNDRKYLIVPEGKEKPEHLGEEFVVLYQPIDNIYLAATAVMALFDSLDALDTIRLSSVQASEWYIERAASAMEEGKIMFAGKYSEPDYELLIGSACDLAIESTMILHSPKVQEMLEDMGIPVLVDRSSYENHPLGRTEWIKFYGALLNKEAEAEAFFAEQANIIDQLKDFPNTEKSVAFFYLSSDGSVVVRKPQDYVPRMIELAGGRYPFAYLGGEDDSKKSSVNLTMEEFYAVAVDADYLVYNATIEDTIKTMEELIEKDALFADFKAVKEEHVWCAGKYLYQATDIVGTMITDLHHMLTDEDESKMTFLTRIQ